MCVELTGDSVHSLCVNDLLVPATRELQPQIARLRDIEQRQAHLLRFANIGDLRRSKQVMSGKTTTFYIRYIQWSSRRTQSTARRHNPAGVQCTLMRITAFM